jgi:hypothetical protein
MCGNIQIQRKPGEKGPCAAFASIGIMPNGTMEGMSRYNMHSSAVQYQVAVIIKYTINKSLNF